PPRPAHGWMARLGRRGPSPATSCGSHHGWMARLGRRGPSPATSCGSHHPSVSPHGGVDRAGPEVQPAGEVLHVGEPEGSQKFGNGGAAHALMAIDDDLTLGIELLGPEPDVLDGDVDGGL